MYICQCHCLTSSQLTLPPPCVLKSILYICVFIPVLPLGSSEPFLDAVSCKLEKAFSFHVFASPYQCAHLESGVWLEFCKTHPLEPLFSALSVRLSAGTLGAHLSPVFPWHRCSLRPWFSVVCLHRLGLINPPRGLLRQSVFSHLSLGQLSLSLFPSPSPPPRKTLVFGGSAATCQTAALFSQLSTPYTSQAHVRLRAAGI